MPVPPPPQTKEEKDDSHALLLSTLDLASKPKPFRNPAWKPSQRRNKNVKQIISEAQRREASVLATLTNSGATTPAPNTDAATPANGGNTVAAAAQNLSTMVLEKNLRAQSAALGTGGGMGGGVGGGGGGVGATYSNIEAAPSLNPAGKKHYCDITGLPASYTDPKTRLRYVNKEVFDVVRGLPQGVAEKYLEVRAAHVVLK